MVLECVVLYDLAFLKEYSQKISPQPELHKSFIFCRFSVS